MAHQLIGSKCDLQCAKKCIPGEATQKLPEAGGKCGATHRIQAGGAADEGVVSLATRVLQQRGCNVLPIVARRLGRADLGQELLCHSQAAAHIRTPNISPLTLC